MMEWQSCVIITIKGERIGGGITFEVNDDRDCLATASLLLGHISKFQAGDTVKVELTTGRSKNLAVTSTKAMLPENLFRMELCQADGTPGWNKE